MELYFLKYLLTNKYVMGFVLLVLVLSSCFAYYKYSSAKIDSLTKKTVELEAIVAQKEQYIESLKVDYTKILKSKTDLEELNQKYSKSINSLRDKLNREARGKMSMSEMASKKPNLIEKYMNEEIKRQLDCIKNINDKEDC